MTGQFIFNQDLSPKVAAFVTKFNAKKPTNKKL